LFSTLIAVNSSDCLLTLCCLTVCSLCFFDVFKKLNCLSLSRKGGCVEHPAPIPKASVIVIHHHPHHHNHYNLRRHHTDTLYACDVEMTSFNEKRHSHSDVESTTPPALRSRDDDDVISVMAAAGTTSCLFMKLLTLPVGVTCFKTVSKQRK